MLVLQLQLQFTLEAGESKTLVLGLGQAANIIQAGVLAKKFGTVQSAKNELERVHSYWQKILSRVHVKTPDRAMDIMQNGWLVYQIISCRLYARSAFYQSGGAYGFRDQLQDTLASLHADPSLTKDQLLLAASRQFKEGDAQH